MTILVFCNVFYLTLAIYCKSPRVLFYPSQSHRGIELFTLTIQLPLSSPLSFSSPHPLTQELRLFHGWEVVICYRRLGKQRGLPLIWTRDHQENHIRGKACLNIAIIAAIISCCLF